MVEHAYIVTDLGFGDAGKGTTVDYLARQADSAVVVRHNGGAQAEHNVVTPDGRHHTFSQFGSGSFVDGVRTHLSRFMMVSPGMMMTEALHLKELGVTDIWQRLTIDEDAPILMPWHRAANRLRELARGNARHGSCGIGISEVQMDRLIDEALVVKAGELQKPRLMIKRFRELQEAKLAQMRRELTVPDDEFAREAWALLNDQDLPFILCDHIEEWLTNGFEIVPGSHLQTLANEHQTMVFEGAQGVLLDEWYGFHPYTTWSTTTSENAQQLLREIEKYDARMTTLGLMRAYTTRHGNGPFVTEDRRLGERIPELHNGTNPWAGAFRYGHLDLVAHRYALDVNAGVDQLVVTGLDRSETWQYATSYAAPTETDVDDFFFLDEDGNIIGIKTGLKGVLDYQARLTELLQACSPRYQPGTVDSSQLLSTIEDAMGVPVGIASYGPTAADKRVPIVC